MIDPVTQFVPTLIIAILAGLMRGVIKKHGKLARRLGYVQWLLICMMPVPSAIVAIGSLNHLDNIYNIIVVWSGAFILWIIISLYIRRRDLNE